MKTAGKIHGILGELDTPDGVLSATKQAYAKGYRVMDAYSPFPVHGLDKALGMKGTGVPFRVFIGGMLGICVGIGIEWWAAVYTYPLNVGGRPFWSWPAFVPVAYECGILFSCITAAFGGAFLMNGLPQPYHPVFNSERFRTTASIDKFFLCIEATDPMFDPDKTARDMTSWLAKNVEEVAP